MSFTVCKKLFSILIISSMFPVPNSFIVLTVIPWIHLLFHIVITGVVLVVIHLLFYITNCINKKAIYIFRYNIWILLNEELKLCWLKVISFLESNLCVVFCILFCNFLCLMDIKIWISLFVRSFVFFGDFLLELVFFLFTKSEFWSVQITFLNA